MSTNLPLRTIQIPALQRQCLFQRRAFSSTPRPSFASTTPHLARAGGVGKAHIGQTRAAARSQTGPAPGVSQAEAQSDVGALAEDIGLLQDTMIRARFRNLPHAWKPKFWGYWWQLVKNKATGMYSRSAYNRLMAGKTGFRAWKPVDFWNGTQLKDIAKKQYIQVYDNFAKGDAAPLSRFCLAPLTRDFKTRIAARGPLKMDWKLLAFKHASIVSHRAQPLGEDQPDTAYRQVVVRIASRQKLTLSGGYTGEGNASKAQLPSRLRWVPEHVRRREEHRGTKKGDGFVDNGKVQEVVEYLVLQNRLIRGEEEGWKVQGFAQESTPARMQEDEEYWNKTLSAQAAEMT